MTRTGVTSGHVLPLVLASGTGNWLLPGAIAGPRTSWQVRCVGWLDGWQDRGWMQRAQDSGVSIHVSLRRAGGTEVQYPSSDQRMQAHRT